tara:strand:- start:1378 stop:2316 length:939 start_codon:yes stop_codon:yes gene_type:complete
MASLTNQTVASSYEQLLHTDTDGGGATTTLVPVKDGDNETTFALQLSSTTVCVDNPTADSSTQGGILQLQSDDNAALQSGSRLGSLQFYGSEAAGGVVDTNVVLGAKIEAFADTGWGASENGTDLAFTTVDGTTASEVMRITADKKVGIGTANPSAGLHVNADPGIRISSGSELWVMSVNSGNGNLYFNDGDANAGIWEDGGSGDFTITGNMVDASDGTLKKSVSTISGGLDKINALRGVTYKWNAESGRKDTDSLHYGVIAQEVESVAPELVSRIEDEDGSIIIGVKYARMVSILIEAVKELSARVATLEG